LRFHQTKFDALESTQRPELSCDLVQFTRALNWMHTSIPNYAEVAALPSRTPGGLLCRCRWADKEETAPTFLNSEMGPCTSMVFLPTQTHLADQTKFALPKPDYDICLCTDASETHLSDVLTPSTEDGSASTCRGTTTLTPRVLPGSFKGPLASWAIVEKEAYSIVESMIHSEHIVGARQVSLYTDRSNFVHIFESYGQYPVLRGTLRRN
jgi:RNase H-like domain found in reverse transcriptase